MSLEGADLDRLVSGELLDHLQVILARCRARRDGTLRTASFIGIMHGEPVFVLSRCATVFSGIEKAAQAERLWY